MINEYDESCEEFSRIEKVYILNYSKPKLILFALFNIITVFLINLFIVWYPKLKLYFIYSKVQVKDGQFVGIFGSGKLTFFLSNILQIRKKLKLIFLIYDIIYFIL